MGSNNKKPSKHKSAFHAAEVMSHDLSLLRGKKQPVFFDDSGIHGLLSAEEIEDEMRKALKEIQSGSFHKEWKKEAEDGFPTLSKLRKEEKKLPIEKAVGLIKKKLKSQIYLII